MRISHLDSSGNKNNSSSIDSKKYANLQLDNIYCEVFENKMQKKSGELSNRKNLTDRSTSNEAVNILENSKNINDKNAYISELKK